MTEVEETAVLISDLRKIKSAIDAAHTYLAADDVARAQRALGKVRYSPLARMLEGAQERINGVLGDWLLARMDEESEEIEEVAELEPLAGSPLGEFKPPRQEGTIVASRRLDPADFIEGDNADDDDANQSL